MTEYLYSQMPLISGGFIAFIFLMKLYKRSVSTTITIVLTTLSINLFNTGFAGESLLTLLIMLLLLTIRAMFKDESDRVIHFPHTIKKRRYTDVKT